MWSLTDKRIELFGERIRQSWADLFFLNRILSTYKFDNIVEIGTGRGMLSIFLRMHHSSVTTIDIRKAYNNDIFNNFNLKYPIKTYVGDCFKDPFKSEIIEIIRSGKTLTYCDGGNKPLELKTFTPHLEKDDVIMCHDKGSEESAWSRMSDTVKKNKLKPFHQEEANKLGASIWSFIK